jgi:hypothetical protein
MIGILRYPYREGSTDKLVSFFQKLSASPFQICETLPVPTCRITQIAMELKDQGVRGTSPIDQSSCRRRPFPAQPGAPLHFMYASLLRNSKVSEGQSASHQNETVIVLKDPGGFF